MNRILIIEDDASIVVGLTGALESQGYDTRVARTGPEGLRLALEERPDLILLDLMLPGMSGLEICKRLRDARGTSRVIMLTSRSAEDDRVFGLELGANDYVTKPFSLRELMARIRTQLRQSPAATSGHRDVYRLGDILVDFRRREVSRGGQPQRLTHREFRLLEYLIEHPNQVLSRERLLQEAWERDGDLTTRTVDNHILRLRRHIEPNNETPRYIKTVRGAGYLLDERES